MGRPSIDEQGNKGWEGIAEGDNQDCSETCIAENTQYQDIYSCEYAKSYTKVANECIDASES
jgi:hypothetical protein